MTRKNDDETVKFNQHLGNRIAEFRKAQGLTMSALAESIGTTRQRIVYIEKGERGITTSNLYHIACALDVPIEEFFTDSPRSLTLGVHTTAILDKLCAVLDSQYGTKKTVLALKRMLMNEWLKREVNQNV
jgi:transcriptional regulator with XRE-family HTH domain